AIAAGAMQAIGVLAATAVGAQTWAPPRGHERLEAALTEAINRAIKPFGANLDRDNIETAPAALGLLDADGAPGGVAITALLDAPHSCQGIEAVAHALKAAAEVFATPHGVPGVRLFDLRAGAPVHFDAREVRVIDLLKLLKRKARPAFYLGS